MRASWLQLTLVEATGFIQTYRIHFFQVAEKRRQIHVLSEMVPGTASSTMIGGLDPDSSYMVFIVSSTSMGEGLSSEGILIEGIDSLSYHMCIFLLQLPLQY